MCDKYKNPVSNEDIIDEITKGIETSCIETAENSGQILDSKLKEENNGCDHNEDLSEDRVANNGNEIPEDYVDEDELKNRDSTLSDTDKQVLKEEAEELKTNGNSYFKNGEFIDAINMYTEGLRTCPLMFNKDRAILYSNRAAAKSKCQDKKESAIEDCTKSIEIDSNYVKAYLRRAQLYEEIDKLDEALSDHKTILTFDPQHVEANHAVRRLPPMIEERNEKLKTEMLGKLKDLGNMILKPFGLSTNNFELQKDPNSGGYSVKFNQNNA